ncbi:MAG: hypothetical protein ACXWUR_11950, partial [Allosphingosinicella sp.]
MTRPILAGLLVLLAILLAGALYWMSLGRSSMPTMSAPASNAAGAVPADGASGSKPSAATPAEPVGEPENSFIICPGHPRCP